MELLLSGKGCLLSELASSFYFLPWKIKLYKGSCFTDTPSKKEQVKLGENISLSLKSSSKVARPKAEFNTGRDKGSNSDFLPESSLQLLRVSLKKHVSFPDKIYSKS